MISAIYAGLLNATLDPYHGLVAVSSVAPLRDLQPNSIPQMLVTLNEWSARCVSTLADLEKQIAGIKAEARRRRKEEEEWAAHVEKLVDSNAKGDGKGKEKEKEKEEKEGGGFLSKIGKLGAGAASKRGSGGFDEDPDEAMEIDEEEEDVEKRSLRSSKKRGFGGLLGSGK